MIDLAATREANGNYTIDGIGWVPIFSQIADAFTKMGFSKGLESFLDTGKF